MRCGITTGQDFKNKFASRGKREFKRGLVEIKPGGCHGAHEQNSSRFVHIKNHYDGLDTGV